MKTQWKLSAGALLMASVSLAMAQDVVNAALERVLLRVSEMACELPQLREMDINPLLIDAFGLVAVDARVLLADQPLAPGSHCGLKVISTNSTATSASPTTRQPGSISRTTSCVRFRARVRSAFGTVKLRSSRTT